MHKMQDACEGEYYHYIENTEGINQINFPLQYMPTKKPQHER